MRILVVCAWCGKLLRIKECDAENTNHNTVSHSIGECCKARVKREADELTAKKTVMA